MCGRFTLLARLAALKDRFDVREIATDYEPRYNSYNIAPTQTIPAVVYSPNGNKLISMKWGMKVGSYNVINSRSDKIADNKTYQRLFAHTRCIIPADGFYEWKTVGTKKLPNFIRLKSKETFSFAGFYTEIADDPTHHYAGSIITTDANSLINTIHNRMPVIIPKKSEKIWLRPVSSEQNLFKLLDPYPADDMEMYIVSNKVNSINNTSPDLIKPKTSLRSFL